MGYKPYSRRKTTVTHVGKVKVGSDFPIRLQSMNNTSTTDVEVSAAQAPIPTFWPWHSPVLGHIKFA